MAREQRVSLCDGGVAFPSAAASHTAAGRGTKVAVLTAEVRLAGVLCSGSGLAPVSQTSVCPWHSSSSSPAATPPSALLLLLLLPRIPSLPSGDSWRLRTVQHLLGRVWGKAVSRLVPKQDSHHRCQLGCVELTKGVDLVGLGHDGVPGRIASHDGRLCVLNWGGRRRTGRLLPTRRYALGRGRVRRLFQDSTGVLVVRTGQDRAVVSSVWCGSWFRGKGWKRRGKGKGKRERSRARKKGGARGGGYR